MMCNSLWIFCLYALIWTTHSSPVLGPRQEDRSTDAELIGDLRNGITTPLGQEIANILLGKQSGLAFSTGTPPKNPATCATSTDVCCPWWLISAALTADFVDKSTGQCTDLARAAIRLGFHDAGSWSKFVDHGGADGSFLLFNEVSRPENRGLEDIDKYARKIIKQYGVGAADLIQYMANHAVVSCPLGPRLRTFVGRKDATAPAPDGLLPSVKADARSLIQLFLDKTITPHMLVALLGAHSTSKQFFVDSSQSGAPQDSTPGTWDVSYYNETLNAPKLASDKKGKNVFQFQSDVAIAADPAASTEWHSFIGDQSHWNEDYATAYIRLSLLGVNNINNLIDCSMTLPT